MIGNHYNYIHIVPLKAPMKQEFVVAIAYKALGVVVMYSRKNIMGMVQQQYAKTSTR